MKFTFLGTSAGLPTKQRNVTSLAISLEKEKGWCLVDCGEGTQQQLLHTPYTLATLEAIFITHIHGDHCYGLPGILATAGMSGRTKPIKIIAPKPIEEFITVVLKTTDCYIPYSIEFIATEELDNDIEIAGFKVEAVELRHRVPSHAWYFTEINLDHKLNIEKLKQDNIPQGPLWGRLCKGENIILDKTRALIGKDYWIDNIRPRKIIISGDNCQPNLLTQASKTLDVLVHEATYTQEVSDKVGKAPMHTSAKDIALFANNLQLPNLVLTHFSARYTQYGKNSIKLIHDEAKKFYCGNLFLAEDFATYHLNKNGQLKQLPNINNKG
ncbi:ribonuclease Z [Pseudoalteromonas denitrificans]|uniref:Ribonuclease Z n=1 Tax=Pseudoalteromonas denitrificans DSM 6059 TaxID=1123010 RepID=A0A1I1KLD3_9GAMM|nr:ribonuclease Z [Pseudoalteromonas denitrificans]SFC61072.1 RNAse Z [Pseudoalteromonas denitrificans DSM 6059]